MGGSPLVVPSHFMVSANGLAESRNSSMPLDIGESGFAPEKLSDEGDPAEKLEPELYSR
jgi:hypothetical protein